jgi:hypothetical protein
MTGFPAWVFDCTHDPVCPDERDCYEAQRDDAAIDAEDARREEAS